MPLEVVRIPALTDNYIWLVHDGDSGATAVVDPGEAAPVIACLDERGWRLDQIWITHWHPDHTAGIGELKTRYAASVTGPEAERTRFAGLDRGVAEGDTLTLGAHAATVIETPGHTAGHIVLHLADDQLLFSGDTLFAMGCGRLFEGAPEQMFGNMARLAALPEPTRVYCGHEYTEANGRFALAADPGNAAIEQRMVGVRATRAAGEATVPTTIGMERATNPFLRAKDAATLAKLRQAKDNFRG